MTNPSARDLHALLSAFAGADPATVLAGLTSPRPTAHRVTFADGTSRHTWCALDCLIVAHLTREDVRVESVPPAPAAAAALHFSVIAGRLEADPSWVLSFPHVGRGDGTHFTEAFCPFAGVFASRADYAAWAPRQPRPTSPVTLADADAIAREYAADVLAAARAAA